MRLETQKAAGDLFARLASTPAVQSLAQRVEIGGALSVAGVAPAAQPFLAVLLQTLFPSRTVVVVTNGVKTQERFQQDVETWLAARVPSSSIESQTPQIPSSILNSPSSPLFYPAWDVLPHEGRLPHLDVISERLDTLVTLSEASGKRGRIVVTTPVALAQRTFAPDDLTSRSRTVRRGDRINPLDLVEWLEDQGYEPEAQVSQKGEIAMRGGIVDVFPPTCPWPARLEFFGDELESMRWFDPQTQMSREPFSSLTLPPAGEIGMLNGRSQKLEVRSEETATTPHDNKTASPKLATLLDYLPTGSLLLICEPEAVSSSAADYAAQVADNTSFFVAWQDLARLAGERGLVWIEAAEDISLESESSEAEPQSESPSQQLKIPLPSLDAFRPLAERAPEPAVAEAQRREFFSQMHRWLRQGYALHVFCNNEGERQRFREIWDEILGAPALVASAASTISNLKSEISDSGNDVPESSAPISTPALQLGTLSRGFLSDDAKLVVVTDAEIFGRYKIQRSRRLKSPHALATRSALDIDFTDLEEGDLVVHLQHGIGRFVGLKVMPLGAGRRSARTLSELDAAPEDGEECLVIEYASNEPTHQLPKLYVPVTEAHLVSKYIGAGKARPPLNTLGGTRWAKAKEHAERAVKDIAAELLALQAARESQAGHAFNEDVPWQREFESAFVFEETPDQMRAILNTKADMERAKPMDRLICGDVGFGKTEVAIRAAFKAVMGGKQVAILVPTTVLAQQHFNTFRERMADYPIRVELLSRFRTRREQDRIVRDLAAGAIDIVIGTHRLVQKDISFKDLGLVVIDEEQRFGVLHKEKFKLLRRLVDVLTLTATPIPRTLYLALTGARDMSTIETPPHDRLPIETIVTNFDERIIRDAIQRELNRGGQVFFLHNRVQTILTMAERLKTLLPHARMVVGHGQMNADDLEEVMTTFVNGQADVLLSTTIIESGLDIPNANTIIIDHADRFGLSDLYQLRGRVGRYKHQAYAYLLIPRHAKLLTDVRKRISAIKQYSTLGSGFKVAMRDLEIRGAGNMLGAEQSGHITAVGFELYCQLLKQSVANLKGEPMPQRVNVAVSLDFIALNPNDAAKIQGHKSEERTVVSAAIPMRYVGDSRQRIEVYRKLAQATTKPELERLETELRDRFGRIPEGVELLLQVAELRVLAANLGATSLEVKDDKVIITRDGDLVQFGGKFPRLTKKTAGPRLKEMKRLLLSLQS